MSAIATVLAGMGHDTTAATSNLRDPPSAWSQVAWRSRSAIGRERRRGRRADLLVSGVRQQRRDPKRPSPRIPVLSRSEMLAAIVALRRTIAIAGTHGKTTTSSMLALVLVEAGLRPSFIIGGEVNEIGTNAAWDQGDLLVVEADESDGRSCTSRRSSGS